jgi:pimeloyl-ACP methyl ester carboxylesterase
VSCRRWDRGGPAVGLTQPEAVKIGTPVTLKTEEFLIPARDAGIELFVRNRAPAGLNAFPAEKTLLFVHGATYPSEVTFDQRLGGMSWMEYIAERGYDVYLLDIRGYGRSTRPPAMAEPPHQHPPIVHTEEAVRDIEAAVSFVLGRRGIARLNLLGWSWGTTTTASFTTRHPQRVNKLILYAPVWTLPSASDPPRPPTEAYRRVGVEEARLRWFDGVPADKRAALIPEGWFDLWSKALLESDPDAERVNPPTVRAPNGVLEDIYGRWLRGERLYDASQLRVPVLIVKGEWDLDTPATMAQGLFRSLTQVPYKQYVEIGEATHTLMLEKNRLQLFRTVQAFLDEGAAAAP